MSVALAALEGMTRVAVVLTGSVKSKVLNHCTIVASASCLNASGGCVCATRRFDGHAANGKVGTTKRSLLAHLELFKHTRALVSERPTPCLSARLAPPARGY
jgi:hypothetical protein